MGREMTNKLVTAITALLAVALAAWGGYVYCTQVTFGGFDKLYALIPAYIASLVAGAVLVELFHEGAHFVAGACCSMGVKPPKFRLFKSSSVQISPKGAKAMRLRLVLTAGAGLFVTLLFIILGVLAFALPHIPAYLGVALPYAFYSFVINAVQLEYSGGKTDGLVIAEVIAKKPTAQVMLAILRVQGLVNAGTPLSEVDENLLLDVPQLPEDDINFIILTQLRYEYYKAKGDEPAAEKYLSRFNEIKQYLPE